MASDNTPPADQWEQDIGHVEYCYHRYRQAEVTATEKAKEFTDISVAYSEAYRQATEAEVQKRTARAAFIESIDIVAAYKVDEQGDALPQGTYQPMFPIDMDPEDLVTYSRDALSRVGASEPANEENVI